MRIFLCLTVLLSLAAGADPSSSRRVALRHLRWSVQDFVSKIPVLVEFFSTKSDPLSAEAMEVFETACKVPSAHMAMLLLRYTPGGCAQMLEAEGPAFVRAVIFGLEDMYRCEPLFRPLPRPSEPPSEIQAALENILPEGYDKLYIARTKRVLTSLVAKRPDVVSYIRLFTAESVEEFAELADAFRNAADFGSLYMDPATVALVRQL